MAGESLIKSFQCPNCGGVIKISAGGRTVAATCSSCKSIVDVSDPQLQIIQKGVDVEGPQPLIPLGVRGKLFDTEFQVIGFLEKEDQYLERWREYLLFNPYKGFAWLVEYNNHWSFVRMVKDKPKINTFGAMQFDGKTFRHFASGTATVKSVDGEFYWQVKVGEEVRTTDYIAPPEILSVEDGDGEITYSHGVYVTAQDVSKGFKSIPLPSPFGISPNQPFPLKVDLGTMWITAVGFFFVFAISSSFTAQSYFENFVVVNLLLFAVPVALSFYRASFESQRYGE